MPCGIFSIPLPEGDVFGNPSVRKKLPSQDTFKDVTDIATFMPPSGRGGSYALP